MKKESEHRKYHNASGEEVPSVTTVLKIYGKEYMRDIANAFYLNKSMTSFTVRNSVRHERDVFVDVLKEMLYEYNIPRKEVFTKIRMYKLL